MECSIINGYRGYSDPTECTFLSPEAKEKGEKEILRSVCKVGTTYEDNKKDRVLPEQGKSCLEVQYRCQCTDRASEQDKNQMSGRKISYQTKSLSHGRIG